MVAYERWSPTRDSICSDLTFGILEKWSLMRGGRKGGSTVFINCEMTLCFFYKNLFHKNVEAEMNQNFKNV